MIMHTEKIFGCISKCALLIFLCLFAHLFINSALNLFCELSSLGAGELLLQDFHKRWKLAGEAPNLLGTFPLLLLAFHARSEGGYLVAQHVSTLLNVIALASFVKLIKLLRPFLDLRIRLINVGLSVFWRPTHFIFPCWILLNRFCSQLISRCCF